MFKYKFHTNIPEYLNDLEDTLRSFGEFATPSDDGDLIDLEQSALGDVVTTTITLWDYRDQRRDVIKDTDNVLLSKKVKKRAAKNILYDLMSTITGVNLPWGSLTGIRPTKIAYEYHEDYDTIRRNYHVSDEKIKLLRDILNSQRGLRVIDDTVADLYVNIPFCISRCTYCSFISALVSQKKRLIPSYVDALIREIESVYSLEGKFRIRSMYVGGGTPTALEPNDLDKILGAMKRINTDEFTVEAGRPDSITEEKLDILKQNGVTRISVNPQTFNQVTLDAVGRKHTVEDTMKSFELVKKYDFIVNADLIAALPGESLSDFIHSVDTLRDIAPDNVTVHTLSIKRSSDMSLADYNNYSTIAKDMVTYAYEKLTFDGYEPYYIYRQKNMSGNLENVGYTKPSHACIYNIDNMEECSSIIACGAGSVSKRLFDGGSRIERYSNAKNIEEYLRRIEEYLTKKIDFFG